MTFSNVYHYQRGPEWGTSTSCHLSPLDLPQFCLKQNFYLLVYGAWRLLGGQCYLLLFEGFVVFDFNQGLTVLSWNVLYRPGVPRTLRSGCSFSAKSQAQKSSTGGPY